VVDPLPTQCRHARCHPAPAHHLSDEQPLPADLQPPQQDAAAGVGVAQQQALVGGPDALDVGDGRRQALIESALEEGLEARVEGWVWGDGVVKRGVGGG
jgi:hypothetical protein